MKFHLIKGLLNLYLKNQVFIASFNSFFLNETESNYLSEKKCEYQMIKKFTKQSNEFDSNGK